MSFGHRATLLLFILCVTFASVPTASAQNLAITINVDANANRHPINPLIYGVAHAGLAALSDLNCPLNRSGGNNTSRYNWQLNADNRGQDWYFQSIAYPSATAGEVGDTFIANSKAANALAMLTIPMVGWVAKLGPNRGKLASFSIAKYGPQTGNDWQWFPDAGNGIWKNGQFVTGNDPNDANLPADSLFQQAWMQHLVNRWGTAATGGLRYYLLDNEPSIWHATHRDVHPAGATMDEVKSKMIDYAAKIKAIDPSVLVVGPEEWGWSGYLLSGYDQQYGSKNGWSNLPDRNNHGGRDYLPWLLDQLRQDQSSRGQRLLDIFSVHYYPQGGEFSNDTSTAMQLRRNRSTRSLWDPNYVDESWINSAVQLVPRLKNWVNTYYPGTPTAITEYNWGAEGHINGATAQADILGIFGREGLDMAARWTTPDPSTPTYKAIKLYRNYDGNGSAFGDLSISATSPNSDNVSAFAAVRRADGAMTVMVISKYLSGTTPITLNLVNFPSRGTAQTWQLTSANQITHLADVSLSGNQLNISVPAQSITLLVLPPSAAPIANVSAASFSGPPLASESIVAAFGLGLATTTQAATTLPLPTSLAGTTVKVKDSAGTERLAPLFFVSPNQVNYQIPPGTAAGTATITITSEAGAVSTGTAQIAAAAPSLFTANASGQGVAAAVALRVKADGSQSYEPVAQFDAAQNKYVSRPIDLGPETDQVYLLLFGTGIRYRSTLSAVSARIGTIDAPALYAGAQGGFVGLDQVNVRLPRSLIGQGEIDLVLAVDGQNANMVRVNIQ